MRALGEPRPVALPPGIDFAALKAFLQSIETSSLAYLNPIPSVRGLADGETRSVDRQVIWTYRWLGRNNLSIYGKHNMI